MTKTRSASVLIGLALLGAACSTAADEAPADGNAAVSEPATGSADNGGSAAGGGGDGQGATIEVKNIAFKPASMKVLKGTEVTWTSMDANVRHTATSGKPGERAIAGVQEGSDAKADGVFDGDLPDAGSEFSFTFKETGTFKYFCEIHPSMVASITVE